VGDNPEFVKDLWNDMTVVAIMFKPIDCLEGRVMLRSERVFQTNLHVCID
jgi:hypothetical protein